ncbi:MAG TPA: SDR family oxidoreductase [Bauldia sp.]|nr:SDR family oxidoreductase [Bauldia sp.]
MPVTDLTTQFAGKVAVITGGTQGLGEATARLLAARGATGIVIVGRNAGRGDSVAASIRQNSATDVRFIAADLARIDEVRAIMPFADAAFHRVDVLVNVAAITDRGTILDTSPELFDRVFATNVRAPFFLMQDAARVMRRERITGAIVNIQSMAAHGGQAEISAYSASKAALAAFTRNVAYSLLPDRIRVNGLNIGWMDTPAEHAIQMRHHTSDANWLARAEAQKPFGRLLKVDEVARAIAYLASDESGMTTGSNIDMDQQVIGAADGANHPRRRLPD